MLHIILRCGMSQEFEAKLCAMSQEFEAKFLNIDPEQARLKLLAIGAKCGHPKGKYIRAVYFMANPLIKGYCRVRYEIDKVFITAKLYTPDPDFPQEFELQLQSNDASNAFDQAQLFLGAIGLTKKAYHESMRELWHHPLAHEITFDTIPGLPTYMEIDCISKENLEKLIELLDLPRENMRFGAYDRTYNEYYGIELKTINDETPYLTFGNILREINPTKNEALLKEIAENQKGL